MFLAFGIFMFAISFVKELKGELRSINKMTRDKKISKWHVQEAFRIHSVSRKLQTVKWMTDLIGEQLTDLCNLKLYF